MKTLSVMEVHRQKTSELGLDPDAVDLTSIEAVAGAIRRAAGFLCPCSAATLVRSVVHPLRGLVEDLQAAKSLAEDTLEAMVADGDILECHDIEESLERRPSTLLYAAPAGFVARESGAVILLGIVPGQLSPLPDYLEGRIEYVNHFRRLRPMEGENLPDELVQLGLIQLSYAEWTKMPVKEQAEQHLAHYDHILDMMQPSRDVPGLSILGPERPVRYYRGRWVEPESRSGRFVGRRSQAYGADLWCYVQLRDGNPEQLVDLPSSGSRWRGCDEAWHLQMAIDAHRGKPQQFRVRPGPGNTSIVEFFSPVPMWARRRWDALGDPVPRSGCLFAYKLPNSELEEELRFSREALWLEQLS